MASLIYSVLHDATTTISDGEIINIKEAKELGLSISGTSTSFTVEFYGSIDGVNYDLIEGSKMSSSLPFITSTTSVGLFSIDIAALVYFKAKISAIANGNVSVTAHAII